MYYIQKSMGGNGSKEQIKTGNTAQPVIFSSVATASNYAHMYIRDYE
jgi:hypothetical protein